MVNPWDLTNDVIGGIGSLVLTPLLWAGLFLWAWNRPAEARESGFGRMTFWLLLPGAVLVSLADAPFLPWAGNVVAINLGGALIPILLALVLLQRTLQRPGWTATALAILFVAAETVAQFGIVLFTGTPWTEVLVIATAGAVTVAALVAFPALMPHPAASRAITFVGLVSVATPLTFLTSEAIPGVGIVSAFPYYLIGPFVVGLAAVWFASNWWGVSPYRGLGVGFGAGILGTLIGADILREPPLYVGGGGALLAIGGAGVLDLVYFSGLMALGAGLLLVVAMARRRPAMAPAATSLPMSPVETLYSAATRLRGGDPRGAIRDAVDASQRAGDQARAIWQSTSGGAPSEAWDGLPVAPYVVRDYQNLVAEGQQPEPTAREAWSSVAMATQFVRLGRDLRRLRFATPGRRAWAVLADLGIVTAPAVALWIYLSTTLTGSIDAILSGLAFNLAVFAYVAYATLYFILFDALFGATLGKFLLRLRVTDRHLARPTVLQSFLRESPKVVPLYILGEFGAPAVLLLVRATSSSISAFGVGVALFTGVALISIVAVTVLLALGIGGIQVARDSERQRLGDHWASTWVVDRRLVTPAWGATLATAPAPPEAAPPG